MINIYDRRSLTTIPMLPSSSSSSNSSHHLPATTSATTSASASATTPKIQKPLKTLQNLTTKTTNLVFSPDGQILVMASRYKRKALRLVHLPSCTVYRNWPTSDTPLGRTTAVAISPDSRLLAVANDLGQVKIWCIVS